MAPKRKSNADQRSLGSAKKKKGAEQSLATRTRAQQPAGRGGRVETKLGIRSSGTDDDEDDMVSTEEEEEEEEEEEVELGVATQSTQGGTRDIVKGIKELYQRQQAKSAAKKAEQQIQHIVKLDRLYEGAFYKLATGRKDWDETTEGKRAKIDGFIVKLKKQCAKAARDTENLKKALITRTVQWREFEPHYVEFLNIHGAAVAQALINAVAAYEQRPAEIKDCLDRFDRLQTAVMEDEKATIDTQLDVTHFVHRSARLMRAAARH
ncbi:hypothetical protein IAU60_000692 [Kwoniella sp. DSM 27419]